MVGYNVLSDENIIHQRTINRAVEARKAKEARRGGRATPFVEVGIADTAIQPGESGEFTLMVGPLPLKAGTEKREAVNLCDSPIAKGAKAKLEYATATDTTGFRIATPCDTGGAAGGCDCCSMLEFLATPGVGINLDGIYRPATVGPEFEELTNGGKLAEMLLDHGCLETVVCDNCKEGRMPAKVNLTLSGFRLTEAASDDEDAFAAFVNRTHQFTFTDDSPCSTSSFLGSSTTSGTSHGVTLSRVNHSPLQNGTRPIEGATWHIDIAFRVGVSFTTNAVIEMGVLNTESCLVLPLEANPSNSIFDVTSFAFGPPPRITHAGATARIELRK